MADKAGGQPAIRADIGAVDKGSTGKGRTTEIRVAKGRCRQEQNSWPARAARRFAAKDLSAGLWAAKDMVTESAVPRHLSKNQADAVRYRWQCGDPKLSDVQDQVGGGRH